MSGTSSPVNIAHCASAIERQYRGRKASQTDPTLNIPSLSLSQARSGSNASWLDSLVRSRGQSPTKSQTDTTDTSSKKGHRKMTSESGVTNIIRKADRVVPGGFKTGLGGSSSTAIANVSSRLQGLAISDMPKVIDRESLKLYQFQRYAARLRPEGTGSQEKRAFFDAQTLHNVVSKEFVLWCFKGQKDVQEQLQSKIPPLNPKYPFEVNQTYLEYIEEQPAKILFALLYSIKQEDFIVRMAERTWTDRNFPFSREELIEAGIEPGARIVFRKRQYQFLVRPLEEGEHIVYDSSAELPVRIGEGLGSGSGGKVMKLHSRLDRRIWAGKQMSTLQGLQKEIENAKKASQIGAHFTSVYASYQQNDKFVMLMEPLAQGNLRQLLASTNRLQQLEYLNMINCLSESLRELYKRGLHHGDLKPENVLLHNGRVVIADFGISRAVGMSMSGMLSEKHPGKPEYGAPEQFTIMAKSYLGRSADVFSMGAICLDILTVCCYRKINKFRTFRFGGHSRLNDFGLRQQDRSYSGNLARVAEWINELRLDALANMKIAKEVVPVLDVVESMLQQDKYQRPKPTEIASTIFKIVRGAYPTDSQPHCTHVPSPPGGISTTEEEEEESSEDEDYW